MFERLIDKYPELQSCLNDVEKAFELPVGYGKAGSFEGFCSGGGIAQLAQKYGEGHRQYLWKAAFIVGADRDAGFRGRGTAAVTFRMQS